LPGGSGGAGQGCGCTGPAGKGKSNAGLAAGFGATGRADGLGLGDALGAAAEGVGVTDATTATGRDPPPVVTATETPATTTAATSAAVSTRVFRGMRPVCVTIRGIVVESAVRHPMLALRLVVKTPSSGGWRVRARSGTVRRAAVAAVVLATTALSLTPGYAAVGNHKQARPQAAISPVWRIWPLGDSITLGAGVPDPGGYRDPLDRTLRLDGVGHKFLGTWTQNPSATLLADGEAHHDGHGGYRVDQVLTDLTGFANGKTDNGGYWLTGTAHRAPIYPDVVIIHLGTNDIFRQYDPGVRYPTSNGLVDFSDTAQRHRFVGDLTQRLTALLDKIYALRPHARIVLSSIVPMHAPYLVASADYASWVSSLVAKERARGHKIVFADVFHTFMKRSRGRGVEPNPGLVGPKGFHPTPAGYELMGHIFTKYVQQVIKL
jgi:lysophospholipase L1-like esterase